MVWGGVEWGGVEQWGGVKQWCGVGWSATCSKVSCKKHSYLALLLNKAAIRFLIS